MLRTEKKKELFLDAEQEGDLMKLPNGYGSVVKLPGARRKPYAVITSYMAELPDGTAKRKRKYIGYFENKALALTFLAEYNQGAVVKEHQSFSQSPTFAEIFDKWKVYRESLKSNPSASTWRNYNIAFNIFSPLHHKKLINIRANELQEIITSKSSKSAATIGNMRVILKGIYSYAINNGYVDRDVTEHLVYEWTDPETPIHTSFSEEELRLLWESLYIVNNVDILLIYIYTGLRPVELLEIKSADVHLDEKYMTGGVKTAAGKNRIIPLHDSIIPLVEQRLKMGNEFLICNKFGKPYKRNVYVNSNWVTVMNNLKLNHAPHDCRYTFGYLADKVGMNEICKKIIMGHSVQNKRGTMFKIGGKGDVTSNVYTEKTLQDLLLEVNKLPVSF